MHHILVHFDRIYAFLPSLDLLESPRDTFRPCKNRKRGDIKYKAPTKWINKRKESDVAIFYAIIQTDEEQKEENMLTSTGQRISK